MSHVELQCVVIKNPKQGKRKRLADIAECGGLHFVARPYMHVAAKLSKLAWCECVIATHVDEHNIGTWRNGKVS